MIVQWFIISLLLFLFTVTDIMFLIDATMDLIDYIKIQKRRKKRQGTEITLGIRYEICGWRGNANS